jgi:Tfp pilus assembly protein PilF
MRHPNEMLRAIRFCVLSTICILSFVLAGCGGVWISYTGSDLLRPNYLGYYQYADRDEKVEGTIAYQALKRNDVVTAVRWLEDVTKANPGNVRDRYRLALLYEACSELDGAEQTINEAIKIETSQGRQPDRHYTLLLDRVQKARGGPKK